MIKKNIKRIIAIILISISILSASVFAAYKIGAESVSYTKPGETTRNKCRNSTKRIICTKKRIFSRRHSNNRRREILCTIR